jgi:hypothetical protein
MYDNDFNMEGFGAMPASPYGVHGMDRSDTNSPLAFRGGVTVADPYPTQITQDIAQGRGSATSNYGDVVEFRDTTDPRQTLYYFDTKTGFITLPSGGKLRPGSGPAYTALLAVYQAQQGSRAAQAGYAATVQTALSNLAQGISAIPSAYAASQTFDAEAARLAQQQAAIAAGGTGTGTGTGTQPPATTPQAGMPTWLWLVILGGGAFVVWSVVKGKE